MKKILKKISAIALFLVLIVTSTLSTEVEAATKGVKKISIASIKSKNLTMNKGTTKTLNVKVKISNKKISKAFTVKSSNKKVVKAVKTGSKIKLTALKDGKSTITVTSKADKNKKCTLKVTVVTPVKPTPDVAVTGISLNKTSATAYAGTKVNLTATIAPSTASNKNVVWESSNNNFATVSNGVVTLKAAGTVTITAKSAANAGIMAKCTITIKAPNGIKSIEYLSSHGVTIELNKAQKLSADQFKVIVGASKRATFICTGEIVDISTKDNKVYVVSLKNDDLDGRYVRVSISGLEGVEGVVKKEIKMMPKAGEVYETELCVSGQASTGKTTSTYVEIDNMYGNYTITYPSETKGFTVSREGTRLYVTRFFDTPGHYEFTYTAKDEYGHIRKGKLSTNVYDSDNMCGHKHDEYGWIKGTSGYSVSNSITVYGGSGSYTYELVGETHGLSINASGKVTGTITKPGDYKVKVKATDASNSSIYTYVEYTVHVEQGILVSGIVKDALGNSMSNAAIDFDNMDIDDHNGNIMGYSKTDGYNIYVVPGIYTIRVNSYDSDHYYYFYNVEVTEKGLAYDVQLPLYKITPEIDSDKYSNVTYWYDASKIDIGYNKTIYLEKGSHIIKAKATRKSDSKNVTLMAKINVTGEMTFTPTEIPYETR